MYALKIVLLAIASLTAALVMACGDDDDVGGEATPTELPSPSPPASPTERPAYNQREIFPPMEGPDRVVAREVVNYWEEAGWELPDPDDLPDLPSSLSDLEPPPEPVCPEGWLQLQRPIEGFDLCHPSSYAIEAHGYVTSGVEERWYSVGFFDFDDNDDELGHVSVYVTGPFNQPFLYVAECDQAYATEIDGVEATVCPEYAGAGGERIIAYHVRTADRDYSFNAVPILDASGTPVGGAEVEATLLQIIASIDLYDRITPAPTAEPTDG